MYSYHTIGDICIGPILIGWAIKSQSWTLCLRKVSPVPHPPIQPSNSRASMLVSGHLLFFELLLGHVLIGPAIVDLSIVSSAVTNISASSADSTHSDSTLKLRTHDKATTTNTKITIHGYLPVTEDTAGRTQHSRATNHSHSRQLSKSSNATHNHQKETVLLTLYPQSHSVASEWLDGLLMLLNQQPITAETNKLIHMVSSYGLKIR